MIGLLSISFVKPSDVRSPIQVSLLLQTDDETLAIDLTEHEYVHLLAGSVMPVNIAIQESP